MMNFDAIMKFKSAWDSFSRNHPKFVMFIQAMGREGIVEGTVIEVKVQSPEGKVTESNMRVTAEDIELFRMLKEVAGRQN